MGKWKAVREVGRKNTEKVPGMQLRPHNLKLTADLSPERGEIRVPLTLPSAARRRDIL